LSFDVVHFPQGFLPDCGESAWKAMDAARHTFVHDKTRHIKYFVLKFPVPIDSHTGRLEFSTRELYDCDDEAKLQLLYPYIEATHSKHPYKMQNQYASWNVVRLDIEPRKRGCLENLAAPLSDAQKAVLRKEQTLFEAAQNAAKAAAEAKMLAEAIALYNKAKGPEPDTQMSMGGGRWNESDDFDVRLEDDNLDYFNNLIDETSNDLKRAIIDGYIFLDSLNNK
jgi:hypothetical protein